jgi:hypothetical protein
MYTILYSQWYSTVYLVIKKLRMLEFLAFDEYCRFDTSALLSSLQRASIYTLKERRSIKTAISIES